MTIQYPKSRPDFSWENLKVGDELGVVKGKIDEGAVRAHAFAIGEDADLYLRPCSGSAALVPPSLLVNELLKLFLIGYDCTRPGLLIGLHAKSLITYEAMALVGDEITITGSHVSKYVRGGRRFRSVLSKAMANGKTVATMLATETVGFDKNNGPDEGEVPANWAADLPKVAPVNLDTARKAPAGASAPGSIIGPIRRWVGMEQSIIFSGFPFSWAHETCQPMRQGLHTSLEIAKKAGFSVPVVQGLLSAAHLTSLLTSAFPGRISGGTQLSLNFIAPVLVGKTLTSYGVVQDRVHVDGRDFVQLSAVTQDQDGRMTTVGYARVPA